MVFGILSTSTRADSSKNNSVIEVHSPEGVMTTLYDPIAVVVNTFSVAPSINSPFKNHSNWGFSRVVVTVAVTGVPISTKLTAGTSIVVVPPRFSNSILPTATQDPVVIITA